MNVDRRGKGVDAAILSLPQGFDPDNLEGLAPVLISVSVQSLSQLLEIK